MFKKLLSLFTSKPKPVPPDAREVARTLERGDLIYVRLHPVVGNRPSMRGVEMEFNGMVVGFKPLVSGGGRALEIQYVEPDGNSRSIVVLEDEFLEIQFLVRNRSKR